MQEKGLTERGKSNHPFFGFRHSYIPRRTGRKKKDVASSSKEDIGRRFLVGAGGLNVAGLLALVADTLTTGLGGAVAGDVANLTTWRRQKRLVCVFRFGLG